ncbi:MAG: ATP-binding cassette domain-containing protein [Psychrosphaera sp.]|nr:ATP-binding cassette domain-containing protein [Psychrosphaera sp.]
MNITIEPGQSVAITGVSGCGKSTLMKIMLGLYIPDQGQVKVDGTALSQLGLRKYRGKVAAVMQDDQLLSGSIEDNISFFAAEKDNPWIVRCARMVGIRQDILKMPMGYHSLVGDLGSSLSGGQRQRVLLARALYQKPRILFLDEATSHLDAGLERAVNQAINELNISRIFIAHRPDTINSAE